MPDPARYMEAMGAAAIASAVWVLATSAVRSVWDGPSLRQSSLGALAVGLAVGYGMLSLNLSWPPRNGLERLLTLVVPVGLVIEWIAGCRRVPAAVVWLLRLSLFLSVPRILLHDSVYLSGTDSRWDMWQAAGMLSVCGLILSALCVSLACLSDRSPGLSVPLALSTATVCSGITVMLAGYVKGGAAAFPMAAVLAATTLSAAYVVRRADQTQDRGLPPVVFMGVLGLFGLVFVGRFFGEVSTGRGLGILLAPQLCWATECLGARHQKSWFVGPLRALLVAIPLIVVLVLAKRDFDRELAPLLTNRRQPVEHRQIEDGRAPGMHGASRSRFPTAGTENTHAYASGGVAGELIRQPGPQSTRSLSRHIQRSQ